MAGVDAVLPLQKAVKVALANAAAVAAITPRFFDPPLKDAQKPYFSPGPIQLLTENAQDYAGGDVSFQLDAWSSDATAVEIKRLGRAAHDALNGAELTLEDDQRLVNLTVDQTRYLRAPDGVTWHMAMILRARTEPSA